jgi:murein DD-endopeptidase MepM/ murein hydrolase activator NlpD
VVETGWRGAYGLVVIVDHGSGVATMYGHCETGSVQVSPGQEVSKGEVLARVDSTGWSTGNHLHFTVFRDGQHVDPSSVF